MDIVVPCELALTEIVPIDSDAELVLVGLDRAEVGADRGIEVVRPGHPGDAPEEVDLGLGDERQDGIQPLHGAGLEARRPG